MSYELVQYGIQDLNIKQLPDDVIADPNYEYEIVWFTAKKAFAPGDALCGCIYKTKEPLSIKELKKIFGPTVKHKITLQFSQIYNQRISEL